MSYFIVNVFSSWSLQSLFLSLLFRRECVVNSPISLSSTFGIGGWSRRLTRLKSWDRMCHVKTRQKHNFFHFSDWHRTLDLVRTSSFYWRFLVFQAYGTFKLFVCFQHKSRSAMLDTFIDSAKIFSDIAIYASVSNCVFGQIVGLPGSCACLQRSALFG